LSCTACDSASSSSCVSIACESCRQNIFEAD
jgi:hypothetical protein